MRIYFLGALLLLIVCANNISAQDKTQQTSSNYYEESRQLRLTESVWSDDGMAAGIGVECLKRMGTFDAGVDYYKGNMHRAQQAEQNRALYLKSDSYMKLSRYLHGYGSFSFKMDREYDRAWSDMRKTYSGNPYTYGSGIKGKYDNQEYSITAKLSSIEIKRMTFGVGIDYTTYDMSRLKDPRTRTLALEARVAPSMTVRLGKRSRIGAEFIYDFSKDRMDNISTVQSNIFEYYSFRGIENYRMTNELGRFKQQQIINGIGWGIQYSYGWDNGILSLAGSYNSRQEDLINGDQNRSYGDYYADYYNASMRLVVKNNRTFHSLKLDASVKHGSAQEFVQEQQNITSSNGYVSSQWVTLYKFITYKDQTFGINGDYTLYIGNISNYDYNYYFGVTGGCNGFENKYLLPYSTQKVSIFDLGFKLGARLLAKGTTRLNVNLKASGHLPVNNKLEVSEKNVVYDNILMPDYLFFERKAVSGYADLIYSMGIGKSKIQRRAFIKAYYNPAFSRGGYSMHKAGMSLGLYL